MPYLFFCKKCKLTEIEGTYSFKHLSLLINVPYMKIVQYHKFSMPMQRRRKKKNFKNRERQRETRRREREENQREVKKKFPLIYYFVYKHTHSSFISYILSLSLSCTHTVQERENRKLRNIVKNEKRRKLTENKV